MAELIAFFRFHGIWAPGVRVFRRISFGAKATLISLAFIGPIALLFWAYLQTSNDGIATSRQERAGVRLIQVREKDFSPARLRQFAAQVIEMARPAGARVLVAGAPVRGATTLPSLAPDQPEADLLTALLSFYLATDATARACGRDPDHPPGLAKATRTH